MKHQRTVFWTCWAGWLPTFPRMAHPCHVQCPAKFVRYAPLRPFSGPFRRHCEAGPLRIYEFCKPGAVLYNRRKEMPSPDTRGHGSDLTMYVTRKRRLDEWGGQQELCAAAFMFNFKIHIHGYRNDTVINQELKDLKDPRSFWRGSTLVPCHTPAPRVRGQDERRRTEPGAHALPVRTLP